MARQDVNLVAVDGIRVIPNWATERTLLDVGKNTGITNEILVKAFNAQLKAEKDESKALLDAVKTQTANISGLRKTTDATAKSSGKPSKFQQEQNKNFRYTADTMKTVARGLLTGSHDASNIFSVVSSSVGTFGRDLKGVSLGLAEMAGGIGVVIEVVDLLVQQIFRLNKSMLSMLDSGVGFDMSMNDLVGSANAAGLKIEDFAAILVKHSATTQFLGDKATTGLIKQFRTLTNLGANLGMSQEQAANGLMNYAEIMKNTGLLGKMTQSDLTKGATEYLQNLNALSAITGKSREEQEKEGAALAIDPKFQLAISGMSANAQKNSVEYMQAMKAAGGERLETAFKDYVGNNGNASLMNKDSFLALNAAHVMPLIDKMYKNLASGDEIKAHTQDIADIGTKLNAKNIFTSGNFNWGSSQNFGPAIAASELRLSSMNMAQKGKEYASGKNITPTNQVITDLSSQADLKSQMDVLSNQMASLATSTDAPIKALQALTGVMKSLNENLPGIIKFIGSISKIDPTGLGGIGILGGLAVTPGLFKIVGSVLKFMTTGSGKTIAEKAIAATSVPTLETLMKPSMNRLRLPNGRFAKQTEQLMEKEGVLARQSAGLAGKLPKGAIASVAGDLEGVAGTGGGGLTGIATGLKAFANPQVVLGAVGFGAAIAAVITGVGVGLAASSWIVGKSLPTMAKGLESFKSVDGKNLLEVGEGLLALGGGMALFSAGSIVSAVGKFFGGDTLGNMSDKLMKLAKMGGPLKSFNDNFISFTKSYKDAIATINSVQLNPVAITTMERLKRVSDPTATSMLGKVVDTATGVVNAAAGAFSRATGGSAPLASNPTELKFQSAMLNYTKEMRDLLIGCQEELRMLTKMAPDQTAKLVGAYKNSNQIY